MHRAAHSGHAGLVGLLLDHNADLDHMDAHFNSPLHKAAAMGCMPVVRILLERRADVNKGDYTEGVKPCFEAAASGHKAVVESLLKGGADVDADLLQVSAKKGHASLVGLLLDRGCGG